MGAPFEEIVPLTLCFVYDEARVLLGLKKRGFGANRWNGFGGKIDVGETIEEAARRELREECGLVATALERRATFDFRSDADPKVLRVHVFRVTDYTGEPEETEEMRPRWFAHAEVPYDDMWSDDRHWLPRFLAGEHLLGTFWFNDLNAEDADLLRYELQSR